MYRVFEALDELSAIVEEARGVPMTAGCVVPRGDVLELIDDIKDAIPGELDDAQDVLDARDEMLREAKEHSESMVSSAKAEAESLVPHIDYALGVASLELGDFAGARDRLSRALFAARRDGDASRQAAALSVLFRTAAKAGDRASAKRYLEEGLTIAVEIRETPRVLKLLIYLAEAWLAAGERLRDAERLLRLALSQPEVAHWARELAEDLLSTAAVEAELAALREPARNGAHAGNGRSKPAPGAPAPPLGAPAITLEEAVALALEHAAADA